MNPNRRTYLCSGSIRVRVRVRVRVRILGLTFVLALPPLVALQQAMSLTIIIPPAPCGQVPKPKPIFKKSTSAWGVWSRYAVYQGARVRDGRPYQGLPADRHPVCQGGVGLPGLSGHCVAEADEG